MLKTAFHVPAERMERKPKATIRDLYPSFSDEELREAEENLERYLELVLRIYERIEQDPVEYQRLLEALRDQDDPPTGED